MNNAFAYSRDQEMELEGQFTRQMSGACLSILRFMVLHANHSPGFYAGTPINRGEIAAAVSHIETMTGLSPKTIRNSLGQLDRLKILSKKGAIEGANQTTLYVIENYEDWDALSEKGQTKGQTRGKLGATSKEEERIKTKDIAHIAREDQVAHSVHPVEDFTPDPTFSPNALLSQWRTDGLPLPRSIHELEQENGLRRLHHDPPHWSTEEIRQALQILRDDFRSGNEQLRWVWKNGPGYLVKKKPDAPQVIEQVLEWKPFLSQQAQATMFGNTKDDDTRTLTQRYLDERNG